jgi:hypothetical protein
MARLTDIKAEIGAMLTGISNFGSVNQPDLALCTFPCANITYKNEVPAGEYGSWHGFDECDFEIELRDKVSSTPDVPLHSMDAVYDTDIANIKAKFRASLGDLPLSGNAVLRYTGFRKEYDKVGDIFTPYKVIITCKVKYKTSEV